MAQQENTEKIEGTRDLRAWLAAAEALGELQVVKGADWNLEIGAISELNYRYRPNNTQLFDEIKGYPPGFRVLTASMGSTRRLAMTFCLSTDLDDQGLVQEMRGKPLKWENEAKDFPPNVVDSGPVLEEVYQGADVDILKFPAPVWHELDGGRYIGSGCAVVTQDPDSDWVIM